MTTSPERKLFVCTEKTATNCIIASTEKTIFIKGRCPACNRLLKNAYSKIYYQRKTKPKHEFPERKRGRPPGAKNKPKENIE
jgi:hypothetical protein